MAAGQRFIPRIDGFAIDCIVSENHERESDVTELPVEDGADTSDNIKPKNRRCSIEGIVTDTPSGDMVAERTNTQDAAVISTQAACEVLESAWAQGRTVSVETEFKTYKSMAIKSLSMPRDSKTGEAFKFSATFEELRIRKTLRVNVKILRIDTRVAPIAKKGPKVTTPVTQFTKSPFLNQETNRVSTSKYNQYVAAGGKLSKDQFAAVELKQLPFEPDQADVAAFNQQMLGDDEATANRRAAIYSAKQDGYGIGQSTNAVKAAVPEVETYGSSTPEAIAARKKAGLL